MFNSNDFKEGSFVVIDNPNVSYNNKHNLYIVTDSDHYTTNTQIDFASIKNSLGELVARRLYGYDIYVLNLDKVCVFIQDEFSLLKGSNNA